ncbi:2TM domain-containing protein [Flagellimonas sp. DF-77]|uniref:2TM domain-containing protein n=1 Tax=Flagellimonas algarum TaxID=3230298 RepID=UPI003390D3EE
MTRSIEERRALAKKKVEEYKGFFRHLKIFLIVNGILFVMRKGWLLPLMPEWFPEEAYYFAWVDLNIIIWGAILAVHALILYRHKFTFLRKWEERQIQKYLDEEQEETKKYK